MREKICVQVLDPYTYIYIQQDIFIEPTHAFTHIDDDPRNLYTVKCVCDRCHCHVYMQETNMFGFSDEIHQAIYDACGWWNSLLFTHRYTYIVFVGARLMMRASTYLSIYIYIKYLVTKQTRIYKNLLPQYSSPARASQPRSHPQDLAERIFFLFAHKWLQTKDSISAT